MDRVLITAAVALAIAASAAATGIVAVRRHAMLLERQIENSWNELTAVTRGRFTASDRYAELAREVPRWTAQVAAPDELITREDLAAAATDDVLRRPHSLAALACRDRMQRRFDRTLDVFTAIIERDRIVTASPALTELALRLAAVRTTSDVVEQKLDAAARAYDALLAGRLSRIILTRSARMPRVSWDATPGGEHGCPEDVATRLASLARQRWMLSEVLREIAVIEPWAPDPALADFRALASAVVETSEGARARRAGAAAVAACLRVAQAPLDRALGALSRSAVTVGVRVPSAAFTAYVAALRRLQSEIEVALARVDPSDTCP